MRLKWLKIIFSMILLTISMAARPEDFIVDSCRTNCSKVDSIVSASIIASEVFQVELALILAIIKVESSFNVKARNGSSVGLMEVNLVYHKAKFKGKNPYNVYDNIFVGTSIFKDCLVVHKTINKALRCYNGSFGSNTYPTKVMKAYKEAKNSLNQPTLKGI